MSTITVSAGATSSGLTVGGGPLGSDLFVLSGGTIVNTTINDEGYVTVSAGGVARGTFANSGSVFFVQSGATASGTIIDSGSDVGFAQGAIDYNTVVNSGALLVDLNTNSGMTVESGGAVYLEDGNATGTVLSGGFFYIYSGVATGTIVDSGGLQAGAGTTIGTVVNKGGSQSVRGVASNSVINSGGAQFVAGGSTTGTIVNSGGIEYLMSGITSGTTINSGGIELVSSGGKASGSIVSNGGMLVLLPGSMANGTVIQAGGIAVSNGVFLDHSSGGGAYYGNAANGVTVNSGSSEFVLSGGKAKNNSVTGLQTVFSGGSTTGTMLHSGGTEDINGGLASGTIVGNGATENVFSNSVAANTTVNSGGDVFVYGTASGTIVNSGAVQTIMSAGSALAATIMSGGKEFVYSAGTASGTVVSSGGILSLLTNKFTNNSLAGTSNTVVSVGGSIDFDLLSYVAGGKASVNTTTDQLVVTEGATTAVLQLSGNYIGGEFDLFPDGAGGTLASFNEIGQTYKLGTAISAVTGGAGDDTFIAANGTLNAGDAIDGGGGYNTLVLSGSGTSFSLNHPTTLVNIQTVIASEGQAASGSIKGTRQTVSLRPGLNVTLNVLGGTDNPSNPNPLSITIYGNTDASTINLGPGSDTVILEGGAETINAGTGTALIEGNLAYATTLINGDGQGKTIFLVWSTGTPIALNPGDSNLTVELDYSSNLTLSAMSYVTVIGSPNADTLTAMATQQTLTGGGGADILIGYGGGYDNFSDATADLNGDTIHNWLSGDVINLTDMNFAGATESFTAGAGQGTLLVSNGSQSASITIIGSNTLANFTLVQGTVGTAINYSA